MENTNQNPERGTLSEGVTETQQINNIASCLADELGLNDELSLLKIQRELLRAKFIGFNGAMSSVTKLLDRRAL